MVLALIVYFKFAAALFLALTMAVVCRPLFEALVRLISQPPFLKTRSSAFRSLASLLTIGIACSLLLVSVLAPLWVLSRNRVVIIKSATGAYDQAREWSRSEIQDLGSRFHIKKWRDFDTLPEPDKISRFPAPGSPAEQNMQDKLIEMVSRPARFLPFALKTVGDGAMLLGQAMVFFMAMHFLLLRGPRFWQDLLSGCPPALRSTLAALGQRTRTVLMATCVVHGLTAVSAFLLALPVFWVIVGREHCLLLAMLAGLFQLIPLLGAATLVSLLTLYFFATGNVLQGWECLLLAFPFIVAVPDLLIRPTLSQRYGKVHAITMLAGFITGIEIFGVLGFVLGPLIFDLIVQFTGQVLNVRKDPPRLNLPSERP